MDKLIKQIQEIIGKHWSSTLAMTFFGEEMCFKIYDSEVPIIYNGKEIYIDCEISNHHLTSDMFNELSQIIELLENNKELLNEFMFKCED